MEMYEDFALVYDRFMDETPYEEWCQFVVGRLKQDQITDGILLDLGCGTGSMTELLAKQGYDMIGVDLSDSMLDIAMGSVRSPAIIFCICSRICGSLSFTERSGR